MFRQLRRSDNLTDRRLSDQSVALIVKRRATAAGVEDRKIANVTRHRNLPVLSGYIRAATAFDDVGKVL